MAVDYDHSKNLHSLEGPRAALQLLFADRKPASLLDVGCGTGTWLRAAMECGVTDIWGLDGVPLPPERLLFPAERYQQQDFLRPWNLGRRFEVVLCLEVAEHLDEAHASTFVDSLVAQGDTILFSAACPGQQGQHHVNCRWPAYWQDLFNQRGFACSDAPRWQIWNDARVEPWYRQNLFQATRDPVNAGREPRIPGIIHPDMLRDLEFSMAAKYADLTALQIEKGSKQVSWYFKTLFTALFAKLIQLFHPPAPGNEATSSQSGSI